MSETLESASRGRMDSSSQPRSSVVWMLRSSYMPWVMKRRSSSAPNLRLSLSVSESSSSPMTVARLRALGLYGAIIGKAYYTGDIDLREAVEAAR